MSDENAKTLQSYEDHVQDYADATPAVVSGAVKDWIDQTLESVPAGQAVLAATGRDADYIESKGYPVQRTDAAAGFVKRLQAEGRNVRVLNAVTGDFGGPFGLIFANAVLLHFTPAQVETVLHKAWEALGVDGILAFSVKQGEGAEWKDAKLGSPRYFQYWSQNSLQAILEAARYDVLSLYLRPSTTRIGTEWLHVIARKRG